MPDTANYSPRETEAFQPVLQVRRGPITVEEYLNTSYSPDREFRDGFALERNVGDSQHAELQAALAHYLRSHRKEWNIAVYTELRIQVRSQWYPIPDVCVYMLPKPKESYPSRPPVLWIEILSPSDSMQEIWHKTRELLANGVPRVWIIDPVTLSSELHTPAGIERSNEVVAVPGTPIEIVLADVVAE